MGLALLLLAASAYAAARETSLFAVRRFDVVGGSPAQQAEVRTALAPLLGRSLLRVAGDDLDRRVAALTDVRSIRFDRSFPHTLEVVVRPERAVLLLRSGSDAWVVSATGRVMGRVMHPGRSSLPRTWIPHTASVSVGDQLSPVAGGRAATALAAARGSLFGRIRSVVVGPRQLTFVLRSGPQLRLGATNELRLKLAISRRILALLGPGTSAAYIDVAVPERPVVGSG